MKKRKKAVKPQVHRNWAKITQIANPYLRVALSNITGTEPAFHALARGFPGCIAKKPFRPRGQKVPWSHYEQVICDMAKKRPLVPREQIRSDVMEQLGIPLCTFSSNPEDTRPEVMTLTSMSAAWSAKCGDIKVIDGANFVVLAVENNVSILGVTTSLLFAAPFNRLDMTH